MTDTAALDRFVEAATSKPLTSLFSARHYEYLAGLAAHVHVNHGDWNLETHLLQAFRVTEANFKPILFRNRVHALANALRVAKGEAPY